MKKFIVKALKVIGIFIGSLIILIIILSIWHAAPQTDSFFIKNAQFARTDFSKLTSEQEYYDKIDSGETSEPAFVVQNHWIQQGNGVIFGWRRYSKGTVAIDDEGYQKITIWLYQMLSTKEVKFGDRTKIIGYFSKGGSAWPSNGCGGELLDGSVTITSSSETSTQMNIQATVDCSHPRGKSHKHVDLDESYSFSRIEFEKITPWLGARGKHIYDETYRRNN